MRVAFGLAVLASACTAVAPSPSPSAPAGAAGPAAPREGRVSIGGAGLYFRDVGQGPPVIVLHGGPDFDHSYLLPELYLVEGVK